MEAIKWLMLLNYHFNVLKQLSFDRMKSMANDEDTIGRINKDIELFSKNISWIASIELDSNEKEVIERSKSYFEDTKYYLEKGDLITSFGCITYAHGLLDAVRMFHGLI
jgi:hypothetical protein